MAFLQPVKCCRGGIQFSSLTAHQINFLQPSLVYFQTNANWETFLSSNIQILTNVEPIGNAQTGKLKPNVVHQGKVLIQKEAVFPCHRVQTCVLFKTGYQVSKTLIVDTQP